MTRALRQCHDRGNERISPVTTTQLTKPRPAEDTLIDALRGCRDVNELKALEQQPGIHHGCPTAVHLDL